MCSPESRAEIPACSDGDVATLKTYKPYIWLDVMAWSSYIREAARSTNPSQRVCQYLTQCELLD